MQQNKILDTLYNWYFEIQVKVDQRVVLKIPDK